MREEGVISGLRLNLITDGNDVTYHRHMHVIRSQLSLPSDSHHSKTRLREFEKVVRFGDTVQVNNTPTYNIDQNWIIHQIE